MDPEENVNEEDGDVDENGDDEEGDPLHHLIRKVHILDFVLKIEMYLTIMELKYWKSMLKRRKKIFSKDRN